MITVVDHKKERVAVCSRSEAARIIGVTYMTILRWSYKKKKENYNQFTVYFHTEIIKQPIRNKYLKSYI